MELQIAGFSLSIVVMVLVEAIKATGYLPAKYSPIVSVLLGMFLATIYGVLSGATGQAILDFVVAGIMAGAIASGLYSGVKAMVGK